MAEKQGSWKKVKPQVHGIVYLHGAGMPDDDKEFVGDPLSEIADGLIDAFNAKGYLREHYRLGVSAECEGRDPSVVNMSVHRKAENGKPEEHAYTLRMRDVLWKPTEHQKSPLDFLPIFWLWALAFNSFAEAKEEKGSQKDTKPQKEKDYQVRLVIANLGLLLACLEAWLGIQAAKMIKYSTEFCKINVPGNDAINNQIKFLCGDGGPQTMAMIASLVASFSIVAAILLALLGWYELADRKKVRVHGPVHQLVMIATTTWLAIFIAPMLVLGYYAKEIARLVIGLALVASIAYVALFIQDMTRIFYLIGIAAVIGMLSFIGNRQRKLADSIRKREVTRRMPKTAETQEQKSVLARAQESTQDVFLLSRQWCMKWFRVLLVVAGAPLVMGVLGMLYVLSLIPIIGETIGKWRDSVAGLGIWIHIKDIDMYLTDSTRAAAARYLVEEKILKINEDTDKDEPAQAIHILAHSLGTAVAYDTLVHLGRGDGGLIHGNNRLLKKIKTLVTFGSPLNKMRKLAAVTERAVDLGEQGPVSILDYDRFGKQAILLNLSKKTRWLNSYALDDVVSDVMTDYVDLKCHLYYQNGQVTHSNPKCQTVHPEDFPCLTATELSTAHGAYWKDKDFWYQVLGAMGIEVSDQPQVEGKSSVAR